MAIELDSLTSTEPADFKRDRWGRPSIMQPNGKRKGYTRCSSAAKTIEDTFNLEKWARRNVAYGMAYDTSLVARVVAIGGEPSSWDKAAKDAVNAIVEDAEQVAKAHRAADIGTAVHRLTERLDRGEDVDGGPYQADLDAYRQAMSAAGFVVQPHLIECRMVNDELEMAGTADRLVYNDLSGCHFVADVKTSASVDFGGLGWAAQLAAYAGAHLYDCENEVRLPTPEIDPTMGFIIHLPAGQGICTIYEIDIAAGLEAARLANQIRATRKAAKQWIKPYTTSTKTASETAPEAQPAPAETAPPAYTKEDVIARYNDMSDSDRNTFRTKRVELGIDNDDVNGLWKLLDDIDHWRHVETTPPEKPAPKPAPEPAPTINLGDPIDATAVNPLGEQYEAMSDEACDWFADLVAQGRHGNTWEIRKSYGIGLNVRNFELYRGLIRLANWKGWDADTVNETALQPLVWAASGNDSTLFANVTAGVALGALDADQATTFSQLVDDLIANKANVVVDDEGRWRLQAAA